jgi:hypothetical protein
VTPTPLDFENQLDPQGCSDGVDNDADGLTDCDDRDCRNIPPCLHLAPVASPSGALMLIAALALVGLVGLLRATRPGDVA